MIALLGLVIFAWISVPLLPKRVSLCVCSVGVKPTEQTHRDTLFGSANQAQSKITNRSKAIKLKPPCRLIEKRINSKLKLKTKNSGKLREG